MISARSRIDIWVQAIRPFAFPASITPVLVAASLAYSYGLPCDWMLLPVILACAMLFHAGTNVVSEYFDFKKGVDRDETFGSSRVLVEGLLSPDQVLRGGIALFAFGCLLGVILLAARGWPMLAFAIVGLLGGVFYTGAPVGYKYRGMGDFMVFLLMGPLMVTGAFYALTGTLSDHPAWVSLPVGFLVAAILNANNIRDIAHDRKAGIVTVEVLMGPALSKGLYLALVGMAYVSVPFMVLRGTLHPLSLMVIVSLPLAMHTATVLLSGGPANREFLALDVQTARLHLCFGLLLCASLIGSTFLS